MNNKEDKGRLYQSDDLVNDTYVALVTKYKLNEVTDGNIEHELKSNGYRAYKPSYPVYSCKNWLPEEIMDFMYPGVVTCGSLKMDENTPLLDMLRDLIDPLMENLPNPIT